MQNCFFTHEFLFFFAREEVQKDCCWENCPDPAKGPLHDLKGLFAGQTLSCFRLIQFSGDLDAVCSNVSHAYTACLLQEKFCLQFGLQL